MKAKLKEYLQQFDHIGIALSGGADSACLLREAVFALGAERIVAFSANSACMSFRRLRMAKKIASLAEVSHIVVEVPSEYAFDMPRAVQCAHCRNDMLRAIKDDAWVRAYAHVANGLHVNDMLQKRADVDISAALGFISPFIACAMHEDDVCALRAGFAFPGQEDSCLLCRINEDVPASFDLMERIDAAEEALEQMGVPDAILRVTRQNALLFLPFRGSLKRKLPQIMITLEQHGFKDVVVKP